MLFAIICNDKADHLQLRLDTRAEHLEYLKNLSDKLVFAGPFLDDAGKPNGSLVVVNVADMAEAENIAAADPYAAAGLFSGVTIRPWNWVMNKPEHLE